MRNKAKFGPPLGLKAECARGKVLRRATGPGPPNTGGISYNTLILRWFKDLDCRREAARGGGDRTAAGSAGTLQGGRGDAVAGSWWPCVRWQKARTAERGASHSW